MSCLGFLGFLALSLGSAACDDSAANTMPTGPKEQSFDDASEDTDSSASNSSQSDNAPDAVPPSNNTGSPSNSNSNNNSSNNGNSGALDSCSINTSDLMGLVSKIAQIKSAGPCDSTCNASSNCCLKFDTSKLPFQLPSGAEKITEGVCMPK